MTVSSYLTPTHGSPLFSCLDCGEIASCLAQKTQQSAQTAHVKKMDVSHPETGFFFLLPAADSTGTHSLYTTYKDYEIMFHVSTLLPYTPNNKQQVSALKGPALVVYC